MLDLILDLLDGGFDHRQNSQIAELTKRLDSFSLKESRAPYDAERSMAAAVVRVLLKKRLITPEELAAEFDVMDAEQIAKIGKMNVAASPDVQAGTLDEAQIARLDQAAADPAPEIKLDLS